MLHDILMILIGIVIGAFIGFFIARKFTKKYMEQNPPAVNVAPLLAQGPIRIWEMGS